MVKVKVKVNFNNLWCAHLPRFLPFLRLGWLVPRFSESPLLGPTRCESVGCSDCRFIGIKECPLGLQGGGFISVAKILHGFLGLRLNAKFRKVLQSSAKFFLQVFINERNTNFAYTCGR